ncbi:hypothetical protein T31B1_10223 [Salinisphaera sp. T31B1]
MVALAITALLAGCGAGGDGGTGQLAGIEGTGIVSGFGSVYIDGIEFDTDDAQVRFNGAPATPSALRVGDVVTVAGTIDDDGRARADRLAFDRLVDGPIERIETRPDNTGELVALGQTVRFDADTRFIRSQPEALKAGDLIAVSGLVDANDVLHASSIEHGPDYSEGRLIDIRGRIDTLTPDRFDIGALTVRYDNATIDDTALAVGDYVQVYGRQYGTGTPLEAERITRPEQRIGNDGERVFLEGVISAVNGQTLTLAGQTVDIGNAERIGPSQAPITSRAKISIRGHRRGEQIVAETISVQPAPTVTLRARLTDIDAGPDRVELLGTRWQVPADTLYVDLAEPADRRLRLSGLRAGDTVQVNGYLDAAGLVMTRLDRVNADPVGDSMVRGPIDSIDRSDDRLTLNIAGATVVADIGRSRFEDADGQAITASAFQAAAAGARAQATGPDNSGRIDIARTVRLLD